MRLVTALIAISIAVSDSLIRAISNRPQSTLRSPSIRSISAATRCLSSRRSPHTSTSSLERSIEFAERRRADGVQRRDDGDAFGDHLRRLLRGRALPDADHSRRLSAERRGERHRGVDQQLAGLQGALEVGERLGLVAERHAEHDQS